MRPKGLDCSSNLVASLYKRLLGFLAACGFYNKHIGRCSIQGVLFISWSSKERNAGSMLRLFEPWRCVFQWTSGSSLWSKPLPIELGPPLLCCGYLCCREVVTSIPFAQTHVDWSQIDFGVQPCWFFEFFGVYIEVSLTNPFTCIDLSPFCRVHQGLFSR